MLFNSILDGLVTESSLVRIQLDHMNPELVVEVLAQDIRARVIAANREIKLVRKARLDAEGGFLRDVFNLLNPPRYASVVHSLAEAEAYNANMLTYINETINPTLLIVPVGSFEHWALTGAVTMLTAIGARVVQHHTNIAAGNILGPMDAFVELV